MTVSTTLHQFLSDHIGSFETIDHPYTEHALDSAHVAHLSPKQVAKAVLLHDLDHYLMAVIPAVNKVMLDRVEQLAGRRMELASEVELPEVFKDCEIGAVPAVGQAFGIAVIWDEMLAENDDIYIESGDHRQLVQLSREQFRNLMENNLHGSISCLEEELHDMKYA